MKKASRRPVKPAEFRTTWGTLMRGGEWVPRNYASHLAGVSNAAIKKAIDSGRLETRQVQAGQRSFVLVRLQQLEKLGRVS